MSAPSPAEELVGAVLNGRFRLVRLLGEGGMGAVYEADSTTGEGKVAVKLLHQEFVKEEAILSRFFAEAATTRAMQHPNVTRLYDTATAENGTPYLVMELLTGTPLSTYVDQGQILPPAQAVNIVYGVLQALRAAHAQGIVHRDLKPDNLFLVPDANGVPNVKVLDFGIAKVMDAAGGMGKKTRTGVLLGTPGYMSPEQVKNSKGVDPRSDLWSVGVILFELLTGRSPFPGDNEFARLTSVLTEEPRAIVQVAPQLAHWSAFFARAFAKEPAQRFQSAEEMAHGVLGSARGGHSLTPPPPSTLQAGDLRPSMASVPYAAVLGAPVQQASGLLPAPSLRVPEPSGIVPSPVVPSPHGTLQSGPMSGPMSTPAGAYSPARHLEASGLLQAPLSAAAAVSAPVSQPPRIASVPPPSMPPTYNPAAAVGPTHVSAQRPAGVPTLQDAVPSIQVIEAPRPAGVPPWVVIVVGVVCLALGLGLGLMLR